MCKKCHPGPGIDRTPEYVVLLILFCLAMWSTFSLLP